MPPGCWHCVIGRPALEGCARVTVMHSGGRGACADIETVFAFTGSPMHQACWGHAQKAAVLPLQDSTCLKKVLNPFLLSFWPRIHCSIHCINSLPFLGLAITLESAAWFTSAHPDHTMHFRMNFLSHVHIHTAAMSGLMATLQSSTAMHYLGLAPWHAIAWAYHHSWQQPPKAAVAAPAITSAFIHSECDKTPPFCDVLIIYQRVQRHLRRRRQSGVDRPCLPLPRTLRQLPLLPALRKHNLLPLRPPSSFLRTNPPMSLDFLHPRPLK